MLGEAPFLMKPHTIQELSVWLNSSHNSQNIIHGFSFDSRTIKPGEVFFALPGCKVDGHTFIQDVAQRNASGAVVSKTYSGDAFGLPLIYVEDVLQALQSCAQKSLQDFKGKIVGVTGSIGKTTTKDFITTILKEKYTVASTPGNSNTQVGIPLALLNLVKGDEDILVLEMGMTLKGHIQNLVQIATPDIALITIVTLVHAAFFSGIEEIAEAKAEIFSHPNTQIGIYPSDVVNKDYISKSGSCNKQTFSLTDPQADFYLHKENNVMFVKTKNENIQLPLLQVPGEHNLYNLLAAITVARNLNVDWRHIQNVIDKLKLPDKRLQPIEKKGILFINDAYNASMLSVKAALKCIPEPKPGKKRIAVLGEMLELGKYSQACHKEVGECALEHVEQLICLGQGCGPLQDVWKNARKTPHWKTSREEVVQELRKVAQPGDVVLLKGSRFFELWKVIDEF
jgi:UDP-N-acetylmuramoyl-tripeptide--D-alanyl-D-alanine ligase